MDEARTLSPAGWDARLRAPADAWLGEVLPAEVLPGVASPARRGTVRDRLFRPMDPEVARSFTDAQVRELERVLAAGPARRQPIDIRITVPVFRRRFFVTLLAGPEHRSPARLEEDRAGYTLWTFWNLCCFVFLLALFVPTFIGLVHIFARGG